MSSGALRNPVAGAEDRRRWLALAVIVTAQFMVVLDTIAFHPLAASAAVGAVLAAVLIESHASKAGREPDAGQSRIADAGLEAG